MIADLKMREFLTLLEGYGFQIHEGAPNAFEADVISPKEYGHSPLLKIWEDGTVDVLFWYNYPVAPIVDHSDYIQHASVQMSHIKSVLRRMEAHALKHGLRVDDTARLLNYTIYGGTQSEIQTGYLAYTPAQLIQLVALRRIPAMSMNTLLAGHVPFKHIKTYDPDISPEMYLTLYPAPEPAE